MCDRRHIERKVPMLGRETRVPPGFAVENVARIGASIWEPKSTIFDNEKDTGFEVDRARFSAPAAAEKTPRRQQPERAIAQMMDPVPGPAYMCDGSCLRQDEENHSSLASMNRVRDP